MTDDRDPTSRHDSSGRRPVPEDESGGEWTRERWKSLSSNPDDETDLGYDITTWEEFESLDNTDQIMFLPDDAEKLRNSAFLVVEEDSIIDLEDRC